MKRDDTKIRIMLVERMLRKDRVISTSEIIRRLDQRGIHVDRKTIYDDMKAINLVIPVISLHGKGGGFMICDVIGECDAVTECHRI